MDESSAAPARAAWFLDKLELAAPFPNRVIQVDGSSKVMAAFEEVCRRRGINLAILPPILPKMNGRVERMQATWHSEFQNDQHPPTRILELNLLIDDHACFQISDRPHDALDG